MSAIEKILAIAEIFTAIDKEVLAAAQAELEAMRKQLADYDGQWAAMAGRYEKAEMESIAKDAEIARLRRVEEAARTLLKADRWYKAEEDVVEIDWPAFQVFEAALEGKEAADGR